MTEQLRWGFICTARINSALIEPLRASSRAELFAVASRSMDRAQAYADEWDIPRAHGSYEELLNDPDVDVIYNALPNNLHAGWTVQALDAGKHVLCEKPFALTVSEVDQMIDAAQRNDRVLQEAFMYRYHPQTRAVQRMVRAGDIGDLRLIRMVFSFMLTHTEDIRLEPELGGGSLWDVGCYPVSFARAVAFGDPETVVGRQVIGQSGVDMTFAGQLHFADGVTAQFDSSFEVPFRSGAEIVGTEATLTLDVPWKPGIDGPGGILLRREGQGEEYIEVDDADPYVFEVESMADCILDDADPAISLSDSRGTVATINALYTSAREGRPIKL